MEFQKSYQLISQQNLCREEGSGMIYLKWWKKKRKKYNQE